MTADRSARSRLSEVIDRVRAARLPSSAVELDPARDRSVRLDSWRNEVTGFGTARDKTSYSSFLPPRLLRDQELAALYCGSDIAARMVDIYPQEMLREPFEVSVGDPRTDALVAERLDELCARERLREGLQWGRLFGGAALVMLAEDGRPASMPLVPERAESLDALHVVDKRQLFPVTFYEEPGHPMLGRPETFMVTPSGRSAGTFVVHESRLVLFEGATTPAQERWANAGWDHSVLQRAYEVIRSFEEGWHAVEVLLVEANVNVYAIAGLMEMASTEDGRALLEKRMQLLQFYQSVVRGVVVDAGSGKDDGGSPAETYDKRAVSWSGIHEVMDRLMYRLCASVRVPQMVMFGQTPGGFSTGENDLRWFYDQIRSEQQNSLAPKVRRIVRTLLATRQGGGLAEGLKVQVRFAPLWSQSPKDEAAARQSLASSDSAYVASGVLLPEEVALSRFRRDGFSSEIVLTDEQLRQREEDLKRRREAEEAAAEQPSPEAPKQEAVPPGQAEDEQGEEEDDDAERPEA